MKEFYDAKQAGYFSSVRAEALDLCPPFSKRALDVGCGEGATLAWLKGEGRCEEAWGIENFAPAAEKAGKALDKVMCVDIDTEFPELEEDYFDLILCLDVLEHLRDPWQAVRRLSRALASGGVFLISLPNLRHFPVMKALVLDGCFTYEERGVMDRTHLRFFTQHSAVELLSGAGLKDVSLKLHPDETSGWRSLVGKMMGGRLRDIFAWQLLVTARKPQKRVI